MKVLAFVCWYMVPTNCQWVDITRSPAPLTKIECHKRAPVDAWIYQRIVTTWEIKQVMCTGDEEL